MLKKLRLSSNRLTIRYKTRMTGLIALMMTMTTMTMMATRLMKRANTVTVIMSQTVAVAMTT